MPKHGDDEEIDALFIPSPEELAALDEVDELDAAESIVHELDDGGATVLAAWAEARWKLAEARGKLVEYEAGDWWHGWHLALSDQIEGNWLLDYDEKGREIWVEEMPPLPRPPELLAEEKAARDRATEEELLAYERKLFGPFICVSDLTAARIVDASGVALRTVRTMRSKLREKLEAEKPEDVTSYQRQLGEQPWKDIRAGTEKLDIEDWEKKDLMEAHRIARRLKHEFGNHLHRKAHILAHAIAILDDKLPMRMPTYGRRRSGSPPSG